MHGTGLSVFAAPLPFSNKQISVAAIVGSTVQEIVLLSLPQGIALADVGAVVTINGEAVPRQCWKAVRPKLGTVVNVRIVPQGGGGKKNPLVSILSIAVLIAAPYMGAALAGSMYGTMGITGATIGFATTAATAAIGVVGSMLISALAPPPKPSFAGRGSSNPSESPTMFVEGARNSAIAYGPVPVVLGTNRMVPPLAARNYTEAAGNKQYARQLFTYGYGQQLLISDLKIGETALSEFKGVEVEHRLEGDLHEGTGLYTQDVFQEEFSVLLSQAAGYVTRTTQADADEAMVDVTFPSGLCRFDSQGKRVARRVRLEMQYAPHGVEPQEWSPAAEAYKEFAGTSIAVQPSILGFWEGKTQRRGERHDFVVIEKYSGRIRLIKGQQAAMGNGTIIPQEPTVPANCIRLALVRVVTERETSLSAPVTSFTVTDIRNPAQFGLMLEDAGSFVPSKSGSNIVISAGAISFSDLDFNESTTEAVRKSVRVAFPEAGMYDLRIRRLTGDSSSDQIIDAVYLTAIKSVKQQLPVKLQGINGTAMRILGSDQLNAAVDQFNALVTSVVPDYNPETGEWEMAATSNPASLWRYVRQGLANARPTPDWRIDIAALEAWWQECTDRGYTYNRVIDYDTSVDDVLRDIAAAGAASPAIVDGKYTVVMDTVKPVIKQIITPRNSWSYEGEIAYPALPHAFRVTFRNAEKGYGQDERIVYDDGYDESNATLFETLELMSCTDAELAWKHGRRHIATARLRPETHSWNMDIENLVALRGDRVTLVHDAPMVGVGSARIKQITTDEGEPELVTAVLLDDELLLGDATYYTRIRLQDGTMLYKQLDTVAGHTRELVFHEPFAAADSVSVGDLCYVVEAGGELDLIITRIEPQADYSARITAVDYAPAIFDAAAGTIPQWQSNITTPLEFTRPRAPVLLNAQSDESVMLRNSDGTLLPRAVFTLQNDNRGEVRAHVRVRPTGTDEYAPANLLEATAERIILTGLEDGGIYDVQIRYARVGTSVLSKPLELNGWEFVGASGLPADVTGFVITVSDQTALLKWDANADIDLSHYTVRFSSAFSAAAWGTAQELEEKVFENRLSTVFQPGTYLIKAVDLSGNESENATVIITYDPGALKNVVAVLQEDPEWAGAKDNTYEQMGVLRLASLHEVGYYNFSETFDLGAVYVSHLSAALDAGGGYANDLFEMEDLLAEEDLFGSAGFDLLAVDDLFEVPDLFGVGVDSWSARIEGRYTDDNPEAPEPAWTEWKALTAGEVKFRAAQFRLRLESLATGITPEVRQARVKIDMPDRIERGEDLTVPVEGISVSFDPAFRATPAVTITIQDGDANDEARVTAKTDSGFTLRIWNTVAAAYVARTFDYIASGYGRRNA